MVKKRSTADQTRAERLLQTSLRPIKRFIALETASGILLVFITAVAMILANSPLREYYDQLFHAKISLTIGSLLHLEHSFLHWINDGLMAIFFFVVGLEIKRELIVGELSSVRKAALPMFAALGGMIIPALIYAFFNADGAGKAGWGIPMATDIAFAVGVLTLLGNRVPFSLRVFLLALAIVDDLGAVMVIAIFYTEQISTQALGVAGALLGLCIFMNKAGVRNILIYVVVGIFIWLAFLKSGVHATIAGVMIGFITPIHAWLEKDFFMRQFSHLSESIFESVKRATGENLKESVNGDTLHDLEELEFLTKESRSPLDRIIHNLHPWVMFVIMPIFALGNAGVYLGNIDFNLVFQNTISIGTFLGLFLGKPIGVFTFCLIAVKLKIADLPEGVSWLQIFGVGIIAGIGFTMALFVSHLALKVPEIEAYSKIGILGASLAASILGFFVLSLAHSRNKTETVS